MDSARARDMSIVAHAQDDTRYTTAALQHQLQLLSPTRVPPLPSPAPSFHKPAVVVGESALRFPPPPSVTFPSTQFADDALAMRPLPPSSASRWVHNATPGAPRSPGEPPCRRAGTLTVQKG